MAHYDTYLRVRDEVLRMRAVEAAASGGGQPSRYWSEELSNIDYMIEASPLVIEKLRHHAFHITNLRPYEYRPYGDRQAYFERRMEALAALGGGTDLLVPEAEALGGFGYSIGGRLYNADTLKFFEVLVGMKRAGTLDPFGQPDRLARRSLGEGGRMVCEIGGGWGGFAYQFKVLFPRTTYVIVDFAELFLFSATYLATVCPDAVVRFWRDGEPTFDRWQDADFIFVPHDRVDALRDTAPDLMVNLVSFQEMTSAQVQAYAALAASIGCPALYSLNRDRSLYNDEIDSVSQILSQHYELREIRLLGSDYTKASKKDSALSVEDVATSGAGAADRYRHLAGALKAPHKGVPYANGEESNIGRPSQEANVGRPFTGRQDPHAPLVGIGVTLHNRATYLAEALDSLLAQSYPHVRIVLVDDGSTDGTEAIARAYAQRDRRVQYRRFEQRRGMVAAWRTAFELATADGATYFAWASDHDRWHSRWLATLVDELQRHPDVVLAYPLTQRIDVYGMTLPKPARRFDTAGVTSLAERWRRFSRSDAVAAGDMVYGVMRAHAARRAGIFREVLCPDRLLMAELTLQGQITQVPEVLWSRRQFSAGSVGRQRASLFAPGAPRPGAMTPPWYMHAQSLWSTYGSGAALPGLPRREIARLVAGYTGAYAVRHYLKTSHDVVSVAGLPRWVYKRLKHGVLLATHTTLVVARRLGITPVIERVIGRSGPRRRAA